MAANRPTAHARLDFAVAGGRTQLLREHVGYPFHITRPFHMDAARPDLATLYLQSASGGLYSLDALDLQVSLAAGAAACVTTQSATIVHDGRGNAARQRTRLTLAPGALGLLAPDPLVLFPGAAIETNTEVWLGAGARGFLQEGFACHDPGGSLRVFERAEQSVVVRDAAGRVLVADRGAVAGARLGGVASPLGPWRACGTAFLLGACWADPAGLEAALTALGCYAGAGLLPNGAGAFLRVLAPDGGTLARGAQLTFSSSFEALTGSKPAVRRK